jgi:N-acetyl-anhydromuramyl-L-alanine amidase AmpD
MDPLRRKLVIKDSQLLPGRHCARLYPKLRRESVLAQDVKYIVVHCSATPPNRDIGAAEITHMHVARGWRTIGYHRVIRRNGRLERGRPFTQMGAHVRGHNAHSVGICLVGGIDNDGVSEMNFTREQLHTLDVVIEDCELMFPNAVTLGHRDLSPDIDNDGVVERHEWLKDCPCLDVRHFLLTHEALFYAR